jgi:hypothetical protein
MMIEVYEEQRREQALMLFSQADYIIAKTSQYSDESALRDGWERANELRYIWTGEKANKSDTVSKDDLLAYMEAKAKNKKTNFQEFVEQNQLNYQS